MQARVVELIPQLLDEGFIEELLMINDDLNNAFIRYERCVANNLLFLEEAFCHSSEIQVYVSFSWLNLYSFYCNCVLGLTDLTTHRLQIRHR